MGIKLPLINVGGKEIEPIYEQPNSAVKVILEPGIQ
jgi:hypothetical protein